MPATARQAQQLDPGAALHRLRAELEQAAGQLAHRAGQPAQQALAHRGVVGEDGAERLGRHRGEQRFAQRECVGEARAAVDRRMLAEHLARRELAEDDAPAAPGVRRDAHLAGDHEVHVAVGAIVVDHDLVALAARPLALRGDLAQRVAVEALEQIDLLQAEQRRHAQGGLGGGLAAGTGRGHRYSTEVTPWRIANFTRLARSSMSSLFIIRLR